MLIVLFLCEDNQHENRSHTPAGVELLTLRIRSANTWIGPWLPSLSGKLIAVASAWPEFIITARTMLPRCPLRIMTLTKLY